MHEEQSCFGRLCWILEEAGYTIQDAESIARDLLMDHSLELGVIPNGMGSVE